MIVAGGVFDLLNVQRLPTHIINNGGPISSCISFKDDGSASRQKIEPLVQKLTLILDKEAKVNLINGSSRIRKSQALIMKAYQK